MAKVKEEQIGKIEGSDHEFLRDNEYIHGGYRLHFNSVGKILRSLFMFHNESFNVWSHLLGVLIFVFLLGYTIIWLGMPAKVLQLHIIDDLKLSILNTMDDLANSAAKYESLIESQMIEIYKDAYTLTHELEDKVYSMYNRISSGNSTESLKPLIKKLESIMAEIDSQKYDWIDVYSDKHLSISKVSRWPIFVYIVSAMICLLCSSIFHLFSAHSLRLNYSLSRLDYAGISILIAGSFYPPVYYAFYCFPRKYYLVYIQIYLLGITVASTITFIISFIPSFQSPSMRWFRGVLFLCLALLGIIPIVHLFFLYFIYSPQAYSFISAIPYLGLMAFSYIFGVCIYISRVPERFYPGKFDFIGHSHNIWHIFVLVAAMFHYFVCLEVYHVRQQLKCLGN